MHRLASAALCATVAIFAAVAATVRVQAATPAPSPHGGIDGVVCFSPTGQEPCPTPSAAAAATVRAATPEPTAHCGTCIPNQGKQGAANPLIGVPATGTGEDFALAIVLTGIGTTIVVVANRPLRRNPRKRT